MPAVSFSCPAKTCAGTRALDHLPFELGAMGASKPMVIQDQKSHAAGLAKHLKSAVSASGMTLGISAPLPEDSTPDAPALFVRDLHDRFREKGFDALIALGSAPAADAAKALNIAVSLGPDALQQKTGLPPPLPSGLSAHRHRCHGGGGSLDPVSRQSL